MTISDDKDELYDLNELYKRGAVERSPVSIDKEIIKLAKANIVNAPATEEQYAPRRKLNSLARITSVAAVMVLSIYLFFDMRHEIQYEPILEESYDLSPDDLNEGAVSSASDEAEPSFKSSEPSAEVFEQESAAIKLEARKEKKRKEKQSAQKKSVQRESKPSLAPRLQKSMEAKPASSPATESLELNKLQHIRDLIAKGEKEKVLELLKEFVQKNPEYQLPDDLLFYLEKSSVNQ